MSTVILRLKRFCGYIAGFVFFISGILKLLDPVGAGLVMDEYFQFLHIGFLSPAAKTAGVMFALAETVLGAGLICGVWRKFIAICILVLQTFFTLLTLVLVIFNPEMDCGCFGEAIHLTHLQTFIKNIILLALLLIYYIPGSAIGSNRKIKYVSFSLVCASVLAFTVYSLLYIPMVDFTAFKQGAVLQAAGHENAEDIYEAVFTYEKDGKTETFTLGHLPDSTWTFVSTETRLKDGFKESGAVLSITDPETGEYVDEMAATGRVMVISLYDNDISDRQWAAIRSFIGRSEAAGFRTMILAVTTEDIPEDMLPYTYTSDYKTLISLNRSNGGLTYLYEGILVRKWASRNLPDSEELAGLSKSDLIEISTAYESKGSLAFQGFLLYVFAVMLLM